MFPLTQAIKDSTKVLNHIKDLGLKSKLGEKPSDDVGLQLDSLWHCDCVSLTVSEA